MPVPSGRISVGTACPWCIACHGTAGESYHPRRCRSPPSKGVLRATRLESGAGCLGDRLLPGGWNRRHALGPGQAGSRFRRRRSRGLGGISLAHNVGSREDVDRVIEQPEAAGAGIARRTAVTFWGGYSGVRRPGWPPWEIAHNPDWKLHDDGTITLAQPGLAPQRATGGKTPVAEPAAELD